MTRSAVLAGLAAVCLAAAPGMAEANHGHDDWRRHGRWDRRGWRGHHHHDRHRTVVIRPSPHVKVVFRGRPYFYRHGRFYERRVRSYVSVPAPVGITVQEIPVEHQTVVIDGVTYHNYGGVYYKGGPAGYTVVSLPVAAPPAEAVAASGDLLTINVPNANGSYTPVMLRETDGLYTGPRGEVYSTKPTVEQLASMYGQ
jgi:hypothetical protein